MRCSSLSFHPGGKNLPLALLGNLQNIQLIRREMHLDCFADQRSETVRFNGIQLNADVAKALGTGVGRLGWSGWQSPSFDLSRCHRDAAERDVGVRRQLSECLLDFLARIHPTRI